MEQGTGKSKVIIDNIAYLYRKGKIDTAIIAAPKGVYRNWLSSEFKTHMPDDVKELTDICVWSPNETKSNVEMLINFLKPCLYRTLSQMINNDIYRVVIIFLKLNNFI